MLLLCHKIGEGQLSIKIIVKTEAPYAEAAYLWLPDGGTTTRGRSSPPCSAGKFRSTGLLSSVGLNTHVEKKVNIRYSQRANSMEASAKSSCDRQGGAQGAWPWLGACGSILVAEVLSSGGKQALCGLPKDPCREGRLKKIPTDLGLPLTVLGLQLMPQKWVGHWKHIQSVPSEPAMVSVGMLTQS